MLLEQLKEQQQQQFIDLKQLHETEKSDILLHQEEIEKRHRQNFEALREKLEIEKNALNDTITEKNRMIDKLNHELDDMRDSIQVGSNDTPGCGGTHSIVLIQGDARSPSITTHCHVKATRGEV